MATDPKTNEPAKVQGDKPNAAPKPPAHEQRQDQPLKQVNED
ncbi:hypothetical protein Q9295_00810 [Xinfangfangia sp. CPCC 101601]|uniref:Uncharacterized protein n=1 Tax=Pseudogemmobacter lacusdianii TaxID=3069608 RepID=A0ABU0VT43_9RHOB|nr:hypothetical protein [Xinfangfangia sp. CPCC 101601]MDQ2064899.1 hypothetical protein [Xinfangfangia sp. CPCC 101601]